MEDEQELPQNVADLAQASVPSAIRGIRACKRCGILKTLDQFVDDGCEVSPSWRMVTDRQNGWTDYSYHSLGAVAGCVVQLSAGPIHSLGAVASCIVQLYCDWASVFLSARFMVRPMILITSLSFHFSHCRRTARSWKWWTTQRR